MKKLFGIIPYLPSPIDDNGKVITSVLSRLCDDLIKDGVHGLCVLGSAGEFSYLSFEQKLTLVNCAVEASASRVPVVAGVCGASTAQAVQEAISFAKLGVDGIVILMQTYFPLTTEEIVSFFRTVAEAVPQLSVGLYSNPKYMHFDLSLTVYEQLSNVPNIRYVKDASGTTGKLLSLVNTFGNRFEIFSASAHIPLFVFQLGGVGWMAGPACLIPRQSVMLYNLYKQGRSDEAFLLQKKLWEMNQLFMKYDLVACVKAGLEHLGYPVGSPIPPLRPLSGPDRDKVNAVMDSIRSIES